MKAVVFYYSQSGQALDVAHAICKAIDEGAGNLVVYRQIVPLQDYPFPWSRDTFFGVFPETRLGLPPSGIQPMDFTGIADADVVFIVGQSWFLSPSLPLQSFFSDEGVKGYLKGRDVIFVNACRNMWLMTGRKVKQYIRQSDACLVGHIVMQDSAPNLVSALSVVRWLMYGRKAAGWLLPEAGISQRDLTEAARFGDIVRQVWSKGGLTHLQDELLSAGAINYKPSVLFLEKLGHRMFGFWATFVRRKGDFGDCRRRHRIRLFFVYLLVVLFLVSPLAQLFFYLTYPLHHVSRERLADCSV